MSIDRLYLATWPIADPDGHCRRFAIARPDGKSLHPADLNAVRVSKPHAVGLDFGDWEDVS